MALQGEAPVGQREMTEEQSLRKRIKGCFRDAGKPTEIPGADQTLQQKSNGRKIAIAPLAFKGRWRAEGQSVPI